VHVEVGLGTWDRTEGFEDRVGRGRDAVSGGHEVRDEGVDEVEDEGGVEKDGGDEVGRREGEGRHDRGL